MKSKQSNLVAGVLLILLGAWFLAVQLVPELAVWFNIAFTWPLIVIAAGVFLLILGFLTHAPGMAIPACIVGGIGGILYYQNLSGDWDSWSYIWSLIPGFVGIGILLSGLLGGGRNAIREGLRLIVISMILFVVFGAFFGALGVVGQYWPVLLILLGIYVLLKNILRRDITS